MKTATKWYEHYVELLVERADVTIVSKVSIKTNTSKRPYMIIKCRKVSLH